MRTSKAQALMDLAASGVDIKIPPPSAGIRRSGVDKSRIKAIFSESEKEIQDSQQTQELMDAPIMDLDNKESDTSDTDDFNAEAEEIFVDKLDTWFAEYAPKLFDLAVSKYLAKKEKNALKGKEDSKTLRPPTKKRKT